VFATVRAPGDYILDGGWDDSAGCRDGIGWSHHIPAADGTLHVGGSPDGWNAVLRRVMAFPVSPGAP
jgi:hypothetical protein